MTHPSDARGECLQCKWAEITDKVWLGWHFYICQCRESCDYGHLLTAEHGCGHWEANLTRFANDSERRGNDH